MYLYFYVWIKRIVSGQRIIKNDKLSMYIYITYLYIYINIYIYNPYICIYAWINYNVKLNGLTHISNRIFNQTRYTRIYIYKSIFIFVCRKTNYIAVEHNSVVASIRLENNFTSIDFLFNLLAKL